MRLVRIAHLLNGTAHHVDHLHNFAAIRQCIQIRPIILIKEKLDIALVNDRLVLTIDVFRPNLQDRGRIGTFDCFKRSLCRGNFEIFGENPQNIIQELEKMGIKCF